MESMLCVELARNNKLLFIRNDISAEALRSSSGAGGNAIHGLIQIQRRIFTASLIDNAFLYYSYTYPTSRQHPALLSEFGHYSSIGRKAVKLRKTRHAEVAIVVDPHVFRHLAPERGNPILAKGDPVPIFLKSFYNNEIGTWRLKPVEDPAPRWMD
ncbi:hypothetical protein IH799_07050 [candidate division KSB1 bacterium]|nr:hypothetical protein [candidate division KSB1 bacterium]